MGTTTRGLQICLDSSVNQVLYIKRLWMPSEYFSLRPCCKHDGSMTFTLRYWFYGAVALFFGTLLAGLSAWVTWSLFSSFGRLDAVETIFVALLWVVAIIVLFAGLALLPAMRRVRFSPDGNVVFTVRSILRTTSSKYSSSEVALGVGTARRTYGPVTSLPAIMHGTVSLANRQETGFALVAAAQDQYMLLAYQPYPSRLLNLADEIAAEFDVRRSPESMRVEIDG